MHFDDAQAAILSGVPFGDVFSLVPEAERDALREWYCTTSGLPNLAGRSRPPAKTQAVPVPSGDMCNKCGGHMVRTGTCMTCSSCGESSGGCG